MAEAVILLAVKKIGIALGNEALSQASSLFKKFITQLTELQGSMGRISRELSLMHEFYAEWMYGRRAYIETPEEGTRTRTADPAPPARLLSNALKRQRTSRRTRVVVHERQNNFLAVSIAPLSLTTTFGHL